MAQSVQHLTLGFSSGHDLTVHEFEPCVRLSTGGAEPAWDPLSLPVCLSVSLPLPCSLSLSLSVSLKINKLKKKKKNDISTFIIGAFISI